MLGPMWRLDLKRWALGMAAVLAGLAAFAGPAARETASAETGHATPVQLR